MLDFDVCASSRIEICVPNGGFGFRRDTSAKTVTVW